jgi:hypothetical protein
MENRNEKVTLGDIALLLKKFVDTFEMYCEQTSNPSLTTMQEVPPLKKLSTADEKLKKYMEKQLSWKWLTEDRRKRLMDPTAADLVVFKTEMREFNTMVVTSNRKQAEREMAIISKFSSNRPVAVMKLKISQLKKGLIIIARTLNYTPRWGVITEDNQKFPLSMSACKSAFGPGKRQIIIDELEYITAIIDPKKIDKNAKLEDLMLLYRKGISFEGLLCVKKKGS